MKEYFHISSSDFLLNNYVKQLGYESDGLILTKIGEGYLVGKNTSMLKWKDTEDNTIDLLIFRNKQSFYELYCQSEGHLVPFDMMFSDLDLEQFNGKICECQYSDSQN